MDRQRLIEVFTDTRQMFREDPVLAQATLQAQAGSVLVMPGFTDIMPMEKSREEEIQVREDTTFHCAQGLQKEGLKTAVLNFANAYNPGGGVRAGVEAQEESLCRCSNLYEMLTLPYMARNYYKYNDKSVGALGTDTLIYSPGVTVVKSDEDLPQRLSEPFRVDVITCAAPYIDPSRKKKLQPEQLENALRSRIRNILETASFQRVDQLVLGAFGCGAFHNPPELVARVFHDLLVGQGYRNRFVRVVFAIRGSENDVNLDVFRSVFAQENGQESEYYEGGLS